MEPSAIASLSTQMSATKVQQSAELSVLKKAIDLQEEGALALLQALPPMPTVSSSGGIAGQFINVKA